MHKHNYQHIYKQSEKIEAKNLLKLKSTHINWVIHHINGVRDSISRWLFFQNLFEILNIIIQTIPHVLLKLALNSNSTNLDDPKMINVIHIFFTMLGIEPSALNMQGKHFNSKPIPSPDCDFFRLLAQGNTNYS
jgi:hypothetical protein